MKKSKVDRLQRMILSDNLRLPGGAMEALKSDLYAVLDGYFDMDETSVLLSVTVREDGGYGLHLQGVAKGAKKVRTIV